MKTDTVFRKYPKLAWGQSTVTGLMRDDHSVSGRLCCSAIIQDAHVFYALYARHDLLLHNNRLRADTGTQYSVLESRGVGF